MTWGFRAQRRADDFNTAVEHAATERAGDAVAPRDAELLALVGALRAVPDPQPRPEFVADLRGRLMAEAENALVPSDVSRLQLPARRTKRERRIAAVVGGLAVVGATTSVAMASQSALPGESLYPIKRVIESAHTGLSLGEARKGSIELSNASSRLAEVAELTADPDPGDDERVATTLGTFTDQATSGADLLLADYAHTGREASISELRDFASSSLDQLADLEPSIPYAARDELIAAASTLAQIDAEAAQQCPSCGGTPIESIPPALVSAEQVDLPTAPLSPRADSSGTPQTGAGKTDDASEGDQAGDDPVLPEVDGSVPPGSVQDPGAATTPSGSPNPLKQLTDGLTGVLTGKGDAGGGTGTGTGSTPTPGATAAPTPLSEVVDGVGGILHGVLDPVTGQLLPSTSPRP
jgi:hypothetical protein